MALGHNLYGFVTQEKTYSDNSVIIKEGDVNRWVFIILEGQCKVKKRTNEGIVVLDILKEGAVLGEVALFEKTSKLATVSVVADGKVRIGVLDMERLVKSQAKLSPAVNSLIESLVLSMRRANTRAAQTAV